MNKIYRVIWNTELGQWVVASEVAKGRKKASGGAKAVAISGVVMLSSLAGGVQAAEIGMGYLDLCGAGYNRTLSAKGEMSLACGYAPYFDLGTTASNGAGISGVGGNVTIYAAGTITAGNTLSMTSHRITNLAQGLNGTDAVNVDQLNAKFAQAGTDPNAVHYDTTTKTKVTLGGGTAGTTIANVKAGAQNNEAVNLGQLKAAGITVDANGTPTNALVAYDTAAKDTVTLSGANGTTIANVKDGDLAVGSKEAVNGGQLDTTNQNVTNLTNNYSTLNTTVDSLLDDALLWDDASNAYSAKHEGASAKITNLAAGTISGPSTDAINGSQLYGTNKSVSEIIGGTGAGLNADGTIKAPTFAVGGKDKASVGDAIAALDQRITNNPAGDALNWDTANGVYTANHDGTASRISNVADGKGPNDAVNKGQLDAVEGKIIEIGPKLKYIKFGTTTALDAFATGSDSLAIGGASFANGDKALAIGGNANAVANSVAIGFGSVATEGGTFAVGGTLAKQHRRIVNVADGIADSDAATVGQLNTKFAEAVQAASTQTVKSPLLKSTGLLGAALVSNDLIKAGPTNMNGAAVLGTDSIAVGLESSAANNRAIAFGVASTAAAEESVAIGQSAVSNAYQGVAIGSQVQAYGTNSLVVGTGGTQVTDTGSYSTAIGYRAVVGGENTIAIGNNILSEGSNNVLLGNKASDANRDNVASVGSKGAERQIIFVKAGVGDTDAVNVSQLKGVTAALGGGAKVDPTTGAVSAPTYTIGGTAYNTVGAAIDALASKSPAEALLWDGTNSVYTAKHGGTDAKIANVAAGAVSGTSTDAINGSQLYTTNKTVSDVIGGSGAGLNTDGTIKAPTFTVDGKDKTTVADAITALEGLIDNASDPLAVKYDGTAKDKITLGGAGATTPVKLTNLADASERRDAVNLGQLQDAGLFDPDGTALDAVVYDKDSAKAKVTFGGTTFNSTTNVGGTKLTNVAVGTQDSDAVNLKQLKDAGLFDTDGKTLNAVVYDNDAKDAVTFGGATGTLLGNVAAGAVSATSKQGINGSQLYATNKVLSEVLGGTDGGLNPDGTVRKPTFDVGGKPYSTVSDAIAAAVQGGQVDALKWDTSAFSAKHGGVDAKITNLSPGAISGSSTDAINGTQLYNTASTLANALGGGSKVDAATGDVTKPTYMVNGTPTAGVDGAIAALDSKVSDSLQWDKTVGAYSASHTGAQTNRIINVANGVNPNDAINKSQLDVVTDDLAPKLKYIKFGFTNAKDAFASGTDAVAIGGASVASGDKALAIGSNATAVTNSVAIGFGSVATEGGTFAVGGGLPSQRRRIVNVAEGVADSDAATVGQLNTKFAEAVQAASTQTVKSPLLRSTALVGATLVSDDLLKAGPTNMNGAAVLGTDAIAIGLESSAANNRAIAFGVASTAAAEESVAIGQSAVSNAYQGVAIGSQVQAYGTNSLVVGTGGTQVTDTGSYSTAIGYRAVVGGENTIAIGNNILSEGSNNVLLGNKASDAGLNNVASVGSKGAERQIIFVKAGTQDTDAVNVSQLKSVATAIGGGSKVGTDGMVTLPTYNLDGKATTGTIADAINSLDKRVTDGGSGTAVDALLWDKDASKFSAAHGADSTPSVITNVADGVLKAGSSDAVTGNQLFGAVSDVAGALGTTVDKDGKLVEPVYTVGGKAANGVDGAVTALDGRIDGVDSKVTTITNNYNTLAGDALKWDSNAAGGAAYSAAHGTQTESRITNVADATQATDAINLRTLDKAIEEVSTKADPSSVKYDSLTTKDKVTFGGVDANGKALTAPVKLTNVAAATADLDAVNLKQLKDAGLFNNDGKVLDAVVYDADSKKASVTFGGANGTILNNVADGLVNQDSRQAVNGGQLFKLKNELTQSITNIDNRVTKIENGGGGDGGSHDYIVANPVPANVDTIKPANAGTTAGIAVGYNASASGDQASAMGDHAVAQAKDSVAVGNNSTVTEAATNSVALGNKSVADTANTVSVGSKGSERTISHVARGTADTDAATMGQMRETLGAANAYTDERMNDIWQDVGSEIDHASRQANRGIAAASALINVTPYVPGHTAVNAGMASYRGETALGVGVSRWSENGRVNFNAGVSAAKDDEPVFRVGIGYIF